MDNSELLTFSPTCSILALLILNFIFDCSKTKLIAAPSLIRSSSVTNKVLDKSEDSTKSNIFFLFDFGIYAIWHLLKSPGEEISITFILFPHAFLFTKLAFISANAFARDRLGLKKGAKIVRLNRLRLANDTPMMLETRYIRTDLCPDIQTQGLSSSLWKVFEDVYGFKPYKHSQNLRIAKISGNSASLLGLKDNSVVFLIKGVTYLENGEAIECEESFYRSDKYDLAFEGIIE